jgi:hypothetical protein
MNVEKPRPRTGDLGDEQLKKVWEALKKDPPGPIQTVKRSREARKKVRAA